MLFKIYVVGEEDDDILWQHKSMMTHLKRLLLM